MEPSEDGETLKKREDEQGSDSESEFIVFSLIERVVQYLILFYY